MLKADPAKAPNKTLQPEKGSTVKKSRFLTPLARKILAINMLTLAIPVAGLLYQGVYKDQLIQQELEALRTQGEIFSGALGEAAITRLNTGQEILNLVPARHIIHRLSVPGRVHARLFLNDGKLAADSERLGGLNQIVEVEDLPEHDSTAEQILEPFLEMMENLTEFTSSHDLPLYPNNAIPVASDFPEAQNALRGGITGVVRQKSNGNLVLSVAFPVQRYYQIAGALMLSKGGAKIDAAMREIRFNLLILSGLAFVLTISLSLYLAASIVSPIQRLAHAAERIRENVGRQDDIIPDFTSRRDAIGELSGVLREMTDALRKRLSAIESFAADVSHEIKNPLTSLKSAVETLSFAKDEAQKKKLLRIIEDDVTRLDRLITDISDASRLDAELSRTDATPVNMAEMLDTLVDMHNTTAEERNRPQLHLDCLGNGPFMIQGIEGRLVQVFRNLFGNAETFSPDNGRISIRLESSDKQITITVEDEGPGIPENKLEAIFDRFYSERPEGEAFGKHSGLGLAISKQIIDAHHGRIYAENRHNPDGSPKGARFIIKLPMSN
ncbi:stimulus-sensing domain-containing protein [Curvivirga aplysinae]|uniref:stimulus-sensing domain-containing protein n=1 Tax=Curvivirga aplysinae TaxID=2529852 RepID=UPI0012BCB2FB|nr:stimulus-sensing domain-containing protein [Curvivirga aplysinae]MTI10250.1 HAMP domain-containing protein [Curvivirga aplysinae]